MKSRSAAGLLGLLALGAALAGCLGEQVRRASAQNAVDNARAIQQSMAGCTDALPEIAGSRVSLSGFTGAHVGGQLVGIAEKYADEVESAWADGVLAESEASSLGAAENQYDEWLEAAYLAAIECGAIQPAGTMSGAPWRSTWWATGTP